MHGRVTLKPLTLVGGAKKNPALVGRTRRRIANGASEIGVGKNTGRETVPTGGINC
jgi:hypothetical protein